MSGILRMLSGSIHERTDRLHNLREGLVCSHRNCDTRATVVGTKTSRKWCAYHARGECKTIPMCSHQGGCPCRGRFVNKRSKRFYCEQHASGVCEAL